MTKEQFLREIWRAGFDVKLSDVSSGHFDGKEANHSIWVKLEGADLLVDWSDMDDGQEDHTIDEKEWQIEYNGGAYLFGDTLSDCFCELQIKLDRKLRKIQNRIQKSQEIVKNLQR